MTDTRSSALFKRAEQLRRWEESDTNRQPTTPRTASKIKFPSGCVFLAACTAGDKEEVMKLHKQGADINTANVDGLTALHQACIDDNLEMVEFLVSRGADVNRGDNEGWTPLHATASCGFLSIARYLIESGADVAAVNYDGELPIDIAESDEMEELLQKVIDERGIDTAGARAAECKRLVADAERWAEKGYCDVRDSVCGATPLHIAAAKGYTFATRLLLERCNVEVDSRDVDGWTPLHAAALWGKKETAELLLRHGADIEAKNYAGQTCADLVEASMAAWLEDRRNALQIRKRTSPADNDRRLPLATEEKQRKIEETSEKSEKENVLELTPQLPPAPSPTTINIKQAIATSPTRPQSPQPSSPIITTVTLPAPITPPTTPITDDTVLSPSNIRSNVENQNGTVNETIQQCKLSPGNIFKNFFKSLVPPVRDEESETQRKAHAKRVRETRRSTQGVTLDEIKSAEQLVRRTNGTVTTGASAIVTPALTASAPVAPVAGASAVTSTANAIACTVTATITPALGERRPSWRLHTQEEQMTTTVNSNSTQTNSSSNFYSSAASSPTSEVTPDKTASNVIQRRRRQKRRSTGVAQVNANEDSSFGDSDLASQSGGEGCDTGDDEEDTRDYKALWEAARAEVDKLKGLLTTSERQLKEARALINQSTFSEIEKREKRAMERKLSEMEEELKQLQKLKAENERLRAENRALTRVVSKLTNTANK